MTQKSKAASLTGELLAPKGAAQPASSAPARHNGEAVEDGSTDVEVARIGAEAPEGEELHNGGIQFPLRLEPTEHLELRMAAARSGLSCQEIIVRALARYLAEVASDPDDTGPSGPGGVQ